ncbi:MAG: hypothetical protein F9K16_13455 [Thermoanaerobaculia bacterium]|nr:MAG: hypothetical protein F9K16_13455 [Thermoanaerobaculia bacterium]MBZ0103540.1 hypothetical protein [Thermoanaerobaculia bacterium]
MNRWTRIVFGLALLGLAGWSWAGWTGHAVSSGAGELPAHALVAFGSTLTLLFVDLWLVVYLLVHQRELRRLGVPRRPSAGIRTVFVAAVAAIGLTIAQFTVAGALYPGRLAANHHALLAFAALLAQLALLGTSVAALRRQAVAD